MQRVLLDQSERERGPYFYEWFDFIHPFFFLSLSLIPLFSLTFSAKTCFAQVLGYRNILTIEAAVKPADLCASYT